MNVERLRVGQGEMANTYLVALPEGGCFIVDFAVEDGNKTQEYCLARFGFLSAVLLTHGHYDHIRGLKGFNPKPPTRVVLHQEEEEFLTNPRLNASYDLFRAPFIVEDPLPFYLCEDEDEIVLGHRDESGFHGTVAKVIHTPFHTQGSVCYYFEEEGVLFSGDTLFRGGIGRYDLPGACPRKMEESLRKLMALPPETKVYPGHGPSSTIGEELRYNPSFLALK
ncbi:MAG: MBL fold metallo-hydrolase [Bacilli bacterium]|nr:MBL fold metallo-hydrolase [Bacilli bacterium]